MIRKTAPDRTPRPSGLRDRGGEGESGLVCTHERRLGVLGVRVHWNVLTLSLHLFC